MTVPYNLLQNGSKLSTWVSEWIKTEYPEGCLLDDAESQKLAVKAVNFYAGYASLESTNLSEESPEEWLNKRNPLSTKDTIITLSEWALIRPLFAAYLEAATAKLLEATRIFGADVGFGRSSSEIAEHIRMLEESMAQNSFYEPIYILGDEVEE